MTSGRRPIPTEVKLAQGTTRDVNYQTPEVERVRPECPKHLDEIGKAEWERLCDLLETMKVLSLSDAPMLQFYCESYSHYRKAEAAVVKVGEVIVKKKKDGTELLRNPFSVELHKYRDALNKMLVEFGLTPSARATLIAPKTTGIDIRKRG